MEVAATASFPVVFFDGEREIDIGNVEIQSSLEFKKFQSVISKKIGISPNQISMSLIRRKISRSSPRKRRRTPITDKSDFGAFLQEKDCFFYVKRVKRERRGKMRQIVKENDCSSPPIEIQPEKAPPPERMLLRRDPGAKSTQFGSVSRFYDQITSPECAYGGRRLGLGLVDYEKQLRNLQVQREKYLMSTTAKTYPYADLEGGYVFARMNECIRKDGIVCEVCCDAKGKPTPFHWCVYDTVTVGFRSPAGPIARPSKHPL